MAAQVVRSFSLCSWTNEVYILSGPKGQLILKQNCGAVTSPKKRPKRTKDTILSAFSLFFGRSYGSTILF